MTWTDTSRTKERPEGFTDVLILSDGAETAAPELGAEGLREIAGGAAVHAVGFGGEKVENLVLEKLFADEFVVAGSAASIEGTVSLVGEGGEVSVEAFVDGERKAARKLKLKGGETGSRFALRLALGEVASLTLMSQRAVPKGLLDLGFQFRYPRLDAALRDILGGYA